MIVRQIQSDPRAREKPCLRCCTSLRKNLDDRFCPECGLSVWLSLNANDSLDSSRPSWLRAASRGAWALALVQPLALVAWILGYIASASTFSHNVLAGSSPDAEEFSDPGGQLLYTSRTLPTTQQIQAITRRVLEQDHHTPQLLALTHFVAGLYFILNAVALFALTVEERRYPDRQRTTRLATRVAASITALVGLLLLSTCLPALLGHSLAAQTHAPLTLLAELSFAAVSICLWLYLRPLATRGLRPTLRRVTSWLLFLPLIGFAKVAPFIGLWFLYLLFPVAQFLPLIYIPTSIILLIQFALMLQRAAPHAEQTWAAESRPEPMGTTSSQ